MVVFSLPTWVGTISIKFKPPSASILSDNDRTMVGIATFDSAIQFYSLGTGKSLPSMMVVTDTTDVFVPDSAPLVRWKGDQCVIDSAPPCPKGMKKISHA